MILKVSTLLGFLTLILPFVAASHWSRHHQRHQVARRPRGDVGVYRRQYYSYRRFTYYDVGLGACGNTNIPSDFIVALSVDNFGSGYPGPHCGASITIQYNGMTAVATIQDECMGCPEGGLDFSSGLFQYFSSLSAGVLYGNWWYNGAGDTSTPAYTPPATSSTPDYTPPATSSTPVYTPPATSSTPVYTPPPTTSTTTTSTSTTTSSTSSATSSIASSTALTSGSAVPTGVVTSTPSANNPANLLVINDIFIDAARLLTAAITTE